MKCSCKMIHPPDGRKSRNMANSGFSKGPTYKAWVGMRSRCRKNTSKGSSHYLGVKLSSEWSEDFGNFLRDMGSKPGKMLSIDRRDNSKGYCKHNCRWATKFEQVMNRRITVNPKKDPGVHKNKHGRWVARIFIVDRMFHIGTYASMTEAKKDYLKFYSHLYPRPEDIL